MLVRALPVLRDPRARSRSRPPRWVGVLPDGETPFTAEPRLPGRPPAGPARLHRGQPARRRARRAGRRAGPRGAAVGRPRGRRRPAGAGPDAARGRPAADRHHRLAAGARDEARPPGAAGLASAGAPGDLQPAPRPLADRRPGRRPSAWPRRRARSTPTSSGCRRSTAASPARAAPTRPSRSPGRSAPTHWRFVPAHRSGRPAATWRAAADDEDDGSAGVRRRARLALAGHRLAGRAAAGRAGPRPRAAARDPAA